MDTREVLTIMGVTLAVTTAYSLTCDLADEPLDLHTPQTDLIHVQAQASAPHRWRAPRVWGNPHS